MMQEVEVLKTIQELICSFFSEEQFTLSSISGSIDSDILYSYTSIGVISHFYIMKEKRLLPSGKEGVQSCGISAAEADVGGVHQFIFSGIVRWISGRIYI